MREIKAKVLALLDKGQADAAAELLKGLKAAQRESAEFYQLLGVVAYQRSQLPEALEYLQKARSLDPHHQEIALCVAATLSEFGSYEQAEKIYTGCSPS
jgi:predicted Zn-dependent protease